MLKGKKDDSIDTIIGSRVMVKGEIKSSGSIRVDGEIEGYLEASGDVVIGDKGLIYGDVTGANVLIAGKVEGNIKSPGRIEISSRGKVKGEVHSKVFIVEEGGVLTGNCKMAWPESEVKKEPFARSKPPKKGDKRDFGSEKKNED